MRLSFLAILSLAFGSCASTLKFSLGYKDITGSVEYTPPLPAMPSGKEPVSVLLP